MKSRLGESLTREAVFRFLLEASEYGNLGLFVGAGFTKAIVDSPRISALGWGDLLAKASKRLEVPLTPLKRDGSGFPDLASRLCEAHAAKTKGKPTQSLIRLKRIISAETAWYPPEDKRVEFSEYLEKVAPAWIITTNYDRILESLLPAMSFSLGPNDTFISRKGLIPIFHLHGVRTDPESLIISQEDYIELFRPNEYRQIRLALALKESTTCLIGYSLGDVNVLTALDWSSKVFEREGHKYPREVIQVLRTTSPKDEPYRLENGIIVVEVKEIASFSEEYIGAVPAWKKRRSRRKAKVKEVLQIFRKSEPDDITRFLEDGVWRRKILDALSNFEVEFIREFEGFLNKAVDLNRRKSSRDGAFHEDAKGLAMSLDILSTFEWDKFPPALLAAVVRNMDRLARYIGDGRGYSYAASHMWANRKRDLPNNIVSELRAIAACHRHVSLENLLEEL